MTYLQANVQSRRQKFLRAAQGLISEAALQLAEGRNDVAFENAYQSALRIAGARIAESVVLSKRKRLPGSAWDKLEMIDEAGAERAAYFRSYSRLRSLVASGVRDAPATEVVQELLDNSWDFLAEVQNGGHDHNLPAAA